MLQSLDSINSVPAFSIISLPHYGVDCIAQFVNVVQLSISFHEIEIVIKHHFYKQAQPGLGSWPIAVAKSNSASHYCSRYGCSSRAHMKH